jgi:hypothetical protein
MGVSVRPDATTVSPKKPAPKGDSGSVPNVLGLPFTIPRVLSPEEFEQAQHAHSGQLAAANFPVLPPVVVNPEGGAGRDFDGVPLGEQAKAGVKAVGHAAAHPVETAKALVQSIADDLTGVFLTPVEGARNEPNAKTGELPYPHLPLGAVVTKENTPNAISREEQHRAALNTAINAAFAMAPELAAPARIATNAAVGAYYDPEQPMRGAVAGAAFGEGMHAAGKAVGAGVRGAKAIGEAGGPALEARPGSVLPQGGSGSPLRPNAPRNASGESYTAPLDAGDNPRMLNVAKLGLSPEGEQQLRAAVPATGEKVKVTHEETADLARELELDPDALMRRIGDWSGAEALAARNLISENAQRMADLAKVTQDVTKPLAERDAAQAEISRLTNDVRTMAGRLAGERTKAGRDLGAFRIIAKHSMEPATWLAQAQRVRGGLPLTPEQTAEILRYTSANDRAGLVSYVSGLAKSTRIEKAITLWRAGLLTGLRTHEVNVVSNIAMAGLETAKDVPAVVIDRLISAVTGETSVSPSFRGNVLEAAKGVGKGFVAAKEVLAKGDTKQLEKWDFRQTNFDSPVAQAYTDAVFRSLSAEDQVARGAAMGRALEEHLRLRARALAKADRTKTAREHLAELRKAPPDDVVIKAIADAEYATFQNENAIATAVSAFKAKLPQGGRAVSDVVVPFVKTPTNVALRMVDYSPAGFFTTTARYLKDPNQRQLAQGLGRAVTGSGLVWLGYALAAEGKATGSAPTSPGQRDLQTMQGAGANKVRMGKKWVDVSRMSPAGALVAVGAQLYHSTHTGEEQTPSARAAAGALSLGKVVLDQPMVSGLSSAMDAAKDPANAGGRFVARTAGSVVPTIVSDIASAMDPSQREAKGIVGAVEARIPGARETLPARLDAFGREVPNQNHGASAFFNALNVSDANDDPLVGELVRLKVSLPQPGKTVRVGKEAHERTDEERRDLKQIIGKEAERRLRKVTTSAAYEELTDEEKKVVLERVIGNVRQGAYAAEKRRVRETETASSRATGGQ